MSQQGSTKKVLRAVSRTNSPRLGSPKVAKKVPSKTPNQLIKMKKKETFNREVDTLIKDHKNLIKIHKRFQVAKASHDLSLTKNGETRIYTRAELAEADKEYERKAQHLKKLYVEGSKNKKTALLPTSFKSPYAPVKVGNVFTTFMGLDAKKKYPNFGLLPDGNHTEGFTGFIEGSNLLDNLPRAKEGLMLKNSLTLLMYIYFNVNALKSTEKSKGHLNIPDERMNNAFGKLDSLYYQEANQPKILMTKSGEKMNTYAVVSGKNTSFNPSKIENFYFKAIQSLNIYEEKDLTPKEVALLANDSLRQELLQEYYLIDAANNLLKKSKNA